MTPDTAFVLEMAAVVCLVVLIVAIVAAAAGACEPVAAAVHDVEQALGPATLMTYDQARTKAASTGTGGNGEKGSASAPAPSSAEEEAPWCAICLSEYAKGDELVRVLPACGHFFHADCRIDWWLRHRGTCPICRGGLRPLPLPTRPGCPPMPPRVAGAAIGRGRG
ncbi:hypothetical protein BDA96_01G161600 [Sorghum bicolor]|uniref:RING-type E3 ubiquitin transferase n=2 Tax=Sorghum bicolor TaxID=4558 RepID=C5WR50_SORBI|nr:RING-H2 finger protein ATL64 [Sorghum bicolor]EER93743.1 hypothetical protein SORBI_3001G153700 [Sorghum bicolor]KAG0548375.1 hypothetical protein BDA96_01G161600 [Sorghum bicolor]|eukprot:XP_002466745.1 RING-H2 finger protein ATL64 [Sorghum bicolor]